MLPRDIAEGWACKDPKAAAEYAKTIPDQDRITKAMALLLVARELAKTDPAAAAEVSRTPATLSLGKWEERQLRMLVAIAEVGQALAKADPAAAVKWADSLPTGEGSLRPGAYDGVAAGWATKDPKAAAAWAESLAPETDRPAALRAAAAAWAKSVPVDADAWAQGLKDNPSAVRALVGVAEGLR